LFVNICNDVGDQIINNLRGRLESVGSTPPNLCDCPKPGHSYQWCGWLFTMISGERR